MYINYVPILMLMPIAAHHVPTHMEPNDNYDTEINAGFENSYSMM